MTYAPVELRHVSFKRSLRGYRREAVDRLLEEVADSFENVWRERAELTDRVEQLEAELARQQELEGLLRTTLMSAERAADELREQARREAAALIEEAHVEARAITREARANREALVLDARRVRALLQAALGALDDSDDTFERTVRTGAGNGRSGLGTRPVYFDAGWLSRGSACGCGSHPEPAGPRSSVVTGRHGRSASPRRPSEGGRTMPFCGCSRSV